MKISEILHEAADVHLWDGLEEVGVKTQYSCCAVSNACWHMSDFFKEDYRAAFEFLEIMGVDTGCFYQFSEFTFGEQRQAARYSWLKFAAMIAEEQGV